MNDLYKPQLPQNGVQLPQNILSMMQNLKSNPVAMLTQAGFNVPQGMNNPNQIINHLMQTGQINTNRLNKAQQMARRFKH